MNFKTVFLVIAFAASAVCQAANAPITIPNTAGQQTFQAQIVDANGNPITGISGYVFTWSMPTNNVLTMNGASTNTGTLAFTPTGTAGTVTISVTAGGTGLTAVSGSVVVTVTGPTPAGVSIIDTTTALGKKP